VADISRKLSLEAHEAVRGSKEGVVPKETHIKIGKHFKNTSQGLLKSTINQILTDSLKPKRSKSLKPKRNSTNYLEMTMTRILSRQNLFQHQLFK